MGSQKLVFRRENGHLDTGAVEDLAPKRKGATNASVDISITNAVVVERISFMLDVYGYVYVRLVMKIL